MDTVSTTENVATSDVSVPSTVVKGIVEVMVTKDEVVMKEVNVITSHDEHVETLELLLLLLLLLLTSLQMVYHWPAERYDVCPGQGVELDDDFEELDDVTDGDDDDELEDEDEEDLLGVIG